MQPRMKVLVTVKPAFQPLRSPAQNKDFRSLLEKLGIMRLYQVVSTAFTFSVGCFLMFLLYVHFTSPNVHIHMSSYAMGQLQTPQKHSQIANNFVKNLNASIRRMDFDEEYTLKNMSKSKDDERMDLNVEVGDDDDKEGQNPLFLDVMKIARLTAKRRGLPDASDPHDLSGYVSILHPGQSLELYCRKCSIVSSSSQILHSGAGPAIDADRSCVFRMNTAPTIHFEQDVGARTTVRVLAHASVSGLFRSQNDLLGDPNATHFLVAWGPERYMKPGGSSYVRLKGLAGNHPRVGFYIVSEEEMKYADLLFEKETGRPRSKSGSWLTTGWFTMILARSVCSEIHVYGMVGENYCKHDHGRKHPYHYYNPHSQDECEYYQSMERAYHGGHRFMTEKAIFASWAKLTPKIYFHQPEWD